MPVSLFTSKLADKVILGEKFMFIKLELTQPNRIEFAAGQYLLLNTPTTPQKRQYSIVSAPRLEHAIELLVEIIPNGQASGYLHQAKPGDEISFYAPAGEFVIKDDVQAKSTPLVFVGTGSGIAPLRSMILDQIRTRETKRQIQLIWGMRYATELFWLDELQELKDNVPNFDFHLTLSQAPEEWMLCRGRVTNCLASHELYPDADYYLCGNSHMIEDVITTLTGRGVDATKIHHEKFT